MNKIYIGFSKPKKWKIFAKLIMLGYGIPYDHVYVRFNSDRYDRDLIYQASKSMVNFMGVGVFSEENIIVDEFEVEISDEKLTAMIQFAIDNAGKAYGVKQAFGMAIVRVAEIFGKYIENPFKDGGKTYVCSELGAYVLEHFAGSVIPKDIDDITPKDLYEYLMKIKASLNNHTI
jgi:hypothetical protein